MDIDMSLLRMLEREKEIPFEVLVEAIEQALLTAYHKSHGGQENARCTRANRGQRPRFARRASRGTREHKRPTRQPGVCVRVYLDSLRRRPCTSGRRPLTAPRVPINRR